MLRLGAQEYLPENILLSNGGERLEREPPWGWTKQVSIQCKESVTCAELFLFTIQKKKKKVLNANYLLQYFQNLFYGFRTTTDIHSDNS